MYKILIIENENIFNAMLQIKKFSSLCSFVYLADVSNLKTDENYFLCISNALNYKKAKNSVNHLIIDKIESIPEQKFTKNIDDTYLLNMPYNIKEVIAVIDSLLALAQAERDSVKINGFEFSHLGRVLSRGGEKIILTEKEANLIALLNLKNGDIVSREEILKNVWEYEEGVDTHTVETHIYRIRQKIGKENEFIASSPSGYFIRKDL